jgi:hypothetical protein
MKGFTAVLNEKPGLISRVFYACEKPFDGWRSKDRSLRQLLRVYAMVM